MATIEQLSFLKDVKDNKISAVNKYMHDRNGNIFVDEHYALFSAVKIKSRALIDKFLTHGLDPSIEGSRAIVEAIKQGDLPLVIELEGFRKGSTDISHLLHAALHYQHEDILMYYLTSDNLSELNKVDHELILNLFANKNSIAKQWLKINKDTINVKTLASYFYKSIEHDNCILTEAILEQGFPLDYMDFKALPLAIIKGANKVTAQLIGMSPDMLTRNNDPVIAAINYSNFYALKLLFKNNFAFKNIDGLLYKASELGQLEAVRWLCKKFKQDLFKDELNISEKLFKSYKKSPAKLIRELTKKDAFLLKNALCYYFKKTNMSPEVYKKRCPEWQIKTIEQYFCQSGN